MVINGYNTELLKDYTHVCADYNLYLKHLTKREFTIADVSLRYTKTLTLPLSAYQNNINYITFTEGTHTIFAFVTPETISPLCVIYSINVDAWATYIHWHETDDTETAPNCFLQNGLKIRGHDDNEDVTLKTLANQISGTGTTSIDPYSDGYGIIVTFKYHHETTNKDVIENGVLAYNGAFLASDPLFKPLTDIDDFNTCVTWLHQLTEKFGRTSEQHDYITTSITGIYLIPYDIFEDIIDNATFTANVYAQGGDYGHYMGKQLMGGYYNNYEIEIDTDPTKRYFVGNSKLMYELDNRITDTQTIKLNLYISNYLGIFNVKFQYNNEIVDFTNAFLVTDAVFNLDSDGIQDQIQRAVKYVSGAVSVIAGVAAIAGSGGAATPAVAAAYGVSGIAGGASTIALTSLDSRNKNALAISGGNNSINDILEFTTKSGTTHNIYTFATFTQTGDNVDAINDEISNYGFLFVTPQRYFDNEDIVSVSYNKTYFKFENVAIQKQYKPTEYAEICENILKNGVTIWKSTNATKHYLNEYARTAL